MKLRSREVVSGLEGLPRRALLKADGLTDADLERPLVAIANSYNHVVPGHLHGETGRSTFLGRTTGQHVLNGGIRVNCALFGHSPFVLPQKYVY